MPTTSIGCILCTAPPRLTATERFLLVCLQESKFALWFCAIAAVSSDHDDSLLSNDMLNESQDFDDEEDLSNPNVQKVGTHLRDLGRADRCVKIRGLTKKFNTPDGVKVAVDDVDMTMYEGQIFVLLGHNGAGKSTTISMATGLIPSTAGHTSIFGQDVATELDEIRTCVRPLHARVYSLRV